MRSFIQIPLWLLLATLAVPLLGLTSPLLEVDDARYAQIPAEMLAAHDWTLPTLDGTPYIEKPPLWYWSAAAAYRIFGVKESTARMVMWLYALLGLVGLFWLGSWLYSVEIGAAAAIATASCALWIFLTHNLTLDLPVSVFLIWTTALALRSLMRPKDSPWAAPAAWVAAALAFLCKGLIAVLLPGLWVAGLAFLFPKMRRGARALLSARGILLATIIVAPWLLAMQHRRPDFFHVFFVEQHFQRYLTPKYHRGAPVWFYLLVLPAGLLPWTAPFLGGLWRAVRHPFGTDPRGPALAAWILGVAVFFSTSHSKLATYILPVIPHACLLAVAAIGDGVPRWAWRLGRLLGGLMIAAAVAGLVVLGFGLVPTDLWPIKGLSPRSLHWLIALSAALMTSLGAAQWVAASSHRPVRALSCGGALAGFFLFFGLRLAAPLISSRNIAGEVRRQAEGNDALWTYGTYLHGLPFYTRRLVDTLVLFTGEFHYAKRDPAYSPRFGDDDAVRALPREGGKTFVVMRSGERPHFQELVAGGIESWQEFGPWSLAVVRRR